MITIENLHKRFRKTEAAAGLSLQVPEGQVTAFLGPNGAGKSTTIKCLLNLHRPDSGGASILGVDSRKLAPEHFTQIGYVSENMELPLWMTVKQFLDYCRPLYPNWDKAFEAQLLTQFDLPLPTKLKDLSRGMRMKAALLSSLLDGRTLALCTVGVAGAADGLVSVAGAFIVRAVPGAGGSAAHLPDPGGFANDGHANTATGRYYSAEASPRDAARGSCAGH